MFSATEKSARRQCITAATKYSARRRWGTNYGYIIGAGWTERPCRQPYVFGPLILLVLPTRVANSNSSSKAKSIKFCSQIGRCKAKPITRHFSGQNVKSVEAKYLVGQALIQIPMQFQLSIQFYGAFKGTWDFFYFNRTKKK